MSDAQVIVVAGSTGALGADVIARLAASGHRLALTSRNTEKLARVAEPYDSDQVLALTANMADPLEASRAVSETLDRFGRVDGLVNLMGDFHVGPVMLTDIATYRRLFETNVLAASTATKAVLPQLSEGSHLVYVSSVLASEPFAGFGAYAASKAALQAWVRSMSHLEHEDMAMMANMVTA